MSPTKSFKSIFFLLVIFSHEFTHVDGVPLSKRAQNSTKLSVARQNKSNPAPKTPSGRNPRFFGKFSIVAGLGLPEPHGQPPINRADLLYDHVPGQFSANYNFPPTRYGPYIAAVYEPPPMNSFFRDPLGYLAAILNPMNWFTTASPGVSIHESTSAQTVMLPDKVQDGDVLLLLEDRENEIPNEDHHLIDDKIESKTETENLSGEKLASVITTATTEPSGKIQKIATASNNFNKNVDLIAEETTVKFINDIKMGVKLEDESRQANRNNTGRPTARPTVPRQSTTTPRTMITSTEISTEESISSEVTEMSTTMFSDNLTMNMTMNTTITNSTQYPDSNNTYPQYNYGYYYDGYPQNISNVELTTSTTATTNFATSPKLQQINAINQFLQQYPNTYYESFEPQRQAEFDYNNRFESLAPEVNDYYNRNNYLSNNQNNLYANGFRPSFPYHL